MNGSRNLSICTLGDHLENTRSLDRVQKNDNRTDGSVHDRFNLPTSEKRAIGMVDSCNRLSKAAINGDVTVQLQF
jgi:hypothetical protein